MGSISTDSVGLVFIPPPLPGHLVSTIKFATQLLERHPGFSITILIVKPTFGPPPPTSSPHESIHLAMLPEVEPPPHELINECIEQYLSNYTTSHRSHIKDAVINAVIPTAAIFFDLFSIQTVDVAKELGLPAYLFYTSGAAFLGLTLHLADRHDQVGAPFSGTDPDEIIPTFKSPFPPRFIPQFLHTKEGFATTLSAGKSFREVKAIITNTFDDLEPYAVESLRRDARNPPIYTVGPILDLVGQAHVKAHKDQHEKIMKWLNDQPDSSVVFLCFGTAGSMQEAQAREVALGLINSGARFLWAVRKPPPEGKTGPPTDYTAEELKELLPELGPVLEKGQGMICGWVPQAEVLAHNAILGFVSHCGWNSILESLWYGRPIVAWPMYAEQQSNSFQLVRELGLAVELRLQYDKESGDVVVADEIEKAIKSLIDPDNEVYDKAKDMAEKSRKAVAKGGSSYNFIGQLIDEILSLK
ncbi:UDP-glycosyltransferase 71K2-like protein [Drosera capensis]